MSSVSAISTGPSSRWYRSTTTARAAAGSAATWPRSHEHEHRIALRGGGGDRLGDRVQRRHRPALALAHGVDGAMRDDAAQPARQVRVRLDGREVAVELHEHVLRQILGRGAIGEHPARDAEHEPLVMAHQIGEGVQVAGPGSGEPAIPRVGSRVGPGRLGHP